MLLLRHRRGACAPAWHAVDILAHIISQLLTSCTHAHSCARAHACMQTTASTMAAVVATPLITSWLAGTLVAVDAKGLFMSTLQVSWQQAP